MKRPRVRFERFMALRYLRGTEGRSEGGGFLRFIIYVAVGGVAVGVAALLLALSIVRGFSEEIEEKIVGFGAHVQVQSTFQDVPLDIGQGFLAELAEVGAVQNVRPVVEGVALLRASKQAIDGVVLRGTPTLSPYLERHIIQGAALLRPDTSRRPGIMVGAPLARRLGLSVGTLVTIFAAPDDSSGSDAHGVARRPRVEQFYVTGIYSTALKDFDERYVYADIAVARELFGYPSQTATRVNLTLQRAERAESVAARIQQTFGASVSAVSIYEAYSGLFAWVNLQESITPFVIAIIIIVAAFNVIGTLLMMMVEKTREIGVLSSLGASAMSVRRLFLMLGLLIGLVGTLLGETLALGLGLLQEHYEVIPLPAEAYYMTHAPIELHVTDFLLVGGIALVLCTAAAYVPARVAGRLDPVRAIRFR